MLKRRGWRVLTAIAALLIIQALAVAAPTAGLASPFTGPFANNNHHYFFYGKSLSDAWANATTWNRNNNLEPTGLVTYKIAEHDSSDVSVTARKLTGDLRRYYGYVTCDRWSLDAIHCNHFHLVYNTNKDHPGGKRVLACHESGHTIGFRDYDGDGSSCTDQSNDSTKPAYFNYHDVWEHINARY